MGCRAAGPPGRGGWVAWQPQRPVTASALYCGQRSGRPGRVRPEEECMSTAPSRSPGACRRHDDGELVGPTGRGQTPQSVACSATGEAGNARG